MVSRRSAGILLCWIAVLFGIVNSQTTYPLKIYTYFNAMDNRYGGGKSGADVEKYFFSKQIMKRVENYYSTAMSVKSAPGNLQHSEFELKDKQKVPVGSFDGHLWVLFDCYNDENDTAFAAASFQDQAPDGRPISGFFELNLYAVSPSPRNALAHYGVFVHEFYHILVLNPDLFKSYRNSAGNEIGESNVISTVSGRTVFKLPGATLNFAKSFLNDNSLSYIVLENGGGAGSIGSHLEYDYWPSDFMSPIDTVPALLSPISMYLAKDAGWYDVNDNYLDPLIYGMNAGANFQDLNICPGNRNPVPVGFCSTAQKGSQMCSPDGMYKGKCGADETYNNNGGCPFIMGTIYCTVPSNDLKEFVNSNLETIGSGSRCASVKAADGSITPACTTTTCSGGTLTYKFSNGGTCSCSAGDAGTDKTCGSLKVKCPDTTSLSLTCDSLDTSKHGCPNDCSGKGFCLGLTAGRKICWCNYGWKGSDCNTENPDEKPLTSAGTSVVGDSNIASVRIVLCLLTLALTIFL